MMGKPDSVSSPFTALFPPLVIRRWSRSERRAIIVLLALIALRNPNCGFFGDRHAFVRRHYSPQFEETLETGDWSGGKVIHLLIEERKDTMEGNKNAPRACGKQALLFPFFVCVVFDGNRRRARGRRRRTWV